MSRQSKRAVMAFAVAGAAALILAPPANADPIRFDNPPGEGHFDWPPLDPAPALTWLDITLDASAQPGTANGPSSFGHKWSTAGNNSSVKGTPDLTELEVNNTTDIYLMSLNAGDTIPSGVPTSFLGVAIMDGNSLLPEGEQTYIGVKFNGPNWQYGWIGVERTGLTLDAFAWGYETEVGVPIAAGAPEPGTLVLLSMGAVGLMRRRR